MGENRLLPEYMAHRSWGDQWPDYVTTWFRGVLLWGVDLDGERSRAAGERCVRPNHHVGQVLRGKIILGQTR